MRARVVTIVAGLLLGGCYHGLDAAPGAGGSEDGGEAGSSGADDDADDGSDTSVEGQCGDAVAIGRTPLRRLTQTQYDATVRDLLGDVSMPAQGFVADEVHGGFTSNTAVVSALQVDQYRQAAAELAQTAASERFGEWLPCDRATDECVEPFIVWFGARAYRRPLTDEERVDYLALYQEGRERWGTEASVVLVVQTMLMSPHFLYHVEIGRGDAVEPGAAVPLTGFEVASRLSYSLWGTMPDDDLFTAATEGALDDADGIEDQARRMLADERASAMVLDFGRQWLELDSVDDANRDAAMYPLWSEELRASIRWETETFLEEVVLHGDGRLETLLAATFSYVDEPLAALYGVEPSDDPLGRTELPAGERAGLLTQASFFLQLGPTPQGTDAIHTGKFVRTRLLCGEMPPPPDNAEFDPTVPRLERDECAGCHVLMDPIGQAFGAYDPIGAYAPVDADGNSVPQDGEVFGSSIGTFDSVVGLAQELATNDEVRACMARNWGWYMLARDIGDEADDCSREHVAAAFAESDHDLRELVIAIVRSDAFRHVQGET